jgi:hypothetical protein
MSLRYFVTYYVDRFEQWAHAYLPEDGGCNTNMFLEAWHKTLKYKYLGEKRQKRLDFVCDRLLQADTDAGIAKERYDALRHHNHKTAIVRKLTKMPVNCGKKKRSRLNCKTIMITHQPACICFIVYVVNF